MNEKYFIIGIGLIILGSFILILWDVYKEYGIIYMWGKIFSWEDRIKREFGFSDEVWSSLDLNEKEVIREIVIKARSENVKLIISNEEKILYPSGDENGMIGVSGYFLGTDEPNESCLGIATGKDKKEWFPVLLHESSHMDQWIEKIPEWDNITYKERDVYDLLDEYIGGKDFPKEEIEEIVKRCILLELDCEKRTFDKLRRYDLNNYDRFDYIMKSNSYIMFYGAILKNRKWYKKPPYEVKEVWSEMPYFFLNDYYHHYMNPSEKYMKLYEKHCY